MLFIGKIKKILRWRRLFFVLLVVNFALAAAIPWFITKPVLGIREEAAETIALVILLSLAYIVNYLYMREFGRLRRYQVNLEDRLQETFKYIGSMNLQLEEMKQAFANFKKYPENKKDIKAVFSYFSRKILSLVNAEWVAIRLVDISSGKSLQEEKFSRNNKAVKYPKIDNKKLLSKKFKWTGGSVISSDQNNFKFKAYCFLPLRPSKDQDFFVRSMINQLEMLFIVFSSLQQSKLKKSINNKK